MTINAPRRQFYGRRMGRPLTAQKRTLFTQALPTFSVPLEEDGPLDLSKIFPHCTARVLEIGFGMGTHLAAQALAHPQWGFIGCDPFIRGGAHLLSLIHDHTLQNVRLVMEDARVLLQKLPSHSLDQVFILFPDPWPKSRHHKRRIVSPPVVGQLERAVTIGGTVTMATDDPDYCQWMQEAMAATPLFCLKNDKTLTQRPPAWVETPYEQKALKAGRQPTYLIYEREAANAG